MREKLELGAEALPYLYLAPEDHVEPESSGVLEHESDSLAILERKLELISEIFQDLLSRKTEIFEDKKSWNLHFNKRVCKELKSFWESNQALYQPTLEIGPGGAYGRLLRFEIYQREYAIYSEVEIETGVDLPITYFKPQYVHPGHPFDFPSGDYAELNQVFIGDPYAGYGEWASGLVISSNQVARTLLNGGRLKLIGNPSV